MSVVASDQRSSARELSAHSAVERARALRLRSASPSPRAALERTQGPCYTLLLHAHALEHSCLRSQLAPDLARARSRFSRSPSRSTRCTPTSSRSSASRLSQRISAPLHPRGRRRRAAAADLAPALAASTQSSPPSDDLLLVAALPAGLISLCAPQQLLAPLTRLSALLVRCSSFCAARGGRERAPTSESEVRAAGAPGRASSSASCARNPLCGGGKGRTTSCDARRGYKCCTEGNELRSESGLGLGRRVGDEEAQRLDGGRGREEGKVR